jgi:molybdopterin-containing oxidoreductase family membrane subunit
MLNMFTHGRLQSPLMWDVVCIGTYLIASVTYLYLPLIPDLALCRDRLTKISRVRAWFYRTFALGWQGTPRQKHLLERVIGVMAILIIPIAVSVHTVVSWVFSMAIQPMWHSTIFGPYFVMGAIFSGIASIIIAMAILRKAFHLEAYLKPMHFNNLGILLVTFTCIWLYFTLAEYLTTFYGGDPTHMEVFRAKLGGEFTVPFVLMVLTCFFIPFSILAFKRTRTIAGTVIASVSVNIGMWLERFLIVVPTLSRPHLPWGHGMYMPSWVELSIFAGEVATFVLLYLLFSRVFPVLSIWEIKEGLHTQGQAPTLEESLIAAEA